jgi:hypothetical protein
MCQDCLKDDECEGEEDDNVWDLTKPIVFLLTLIVWTLFYAIVNR